MIRNAPVNSGKPAVVLLLLSSAYIAITLNIQGFVGMMPLVRAEFTISGAQAGLYTSFYFLSATVIAVFSGRIVDRLGTRRGLVIGTGVVGAMMLLHSFSPAYQVILALAFVTGVAFSLITPSVSKGVMENVSSRRRAGAMGIAHGVGGSGALFGTALMPYFAETYGWRAVLSVGGLVALVVSAVILRSYRWAAVPEPEPQGGSSAGDAGKTSLKDDLKQLLTNRPFLLICLIGMVFGIGLSSATAHMALFLNQDLGYSPAHAGLGLSAFHVGGVVGQPSWGVINDKLLGRRRRRGLLLLSLSTSVLAFVMAAFVAPGYLPLGGVLGVSLLLGFCVLGMPSLYLTTISELSPPQRTGVATGVAVVFTRTGIVLAAPIFGLLADISGDYTLSWFVLGSVVAAIAAAVMMLARRYHV